ncbi:MAG TPA: hypothetical protein DCM71_00800 [Runella sp.]|nr:hypothetical protein [Runella sp.]
MMIFPARMSSIADSMVSSLMELVLLLLSMYQIKIVCEKQRFMFTILRSACNSFRSKFVSKTTFCKDTFFGEKEIGNHKSMKSSLVLFFFLVSLAVLGQDWCDPAQRPKDQVIGQGGFTVQGSTTGCLLYDVKVEASVAGSSIQYIYDYKGGDPTKAPNAPIPSTSHRYTKLGKYTILQLVSTGGTGAIACRVVEAVTAPNYKVQVCSGRKVVVTIADDSTTKGYESFMVNFGGSVFIPVSKANSPYVISYAYPATSNVATISVTGIAPGNIPLTCKKDTIVTLNSANATGVSIRKVTTRPDGTVDVLVKGSAGIKADIQIDEGATGTFKNTGQSATTNDTTTVTIRAINAAQSAYCFRLSTSDVCDNTTTTSSVVCATSLDVVAQNQQNVLTWKEYPHAASFQNYRVNLNGTPSPVVTNRTTTTQTDRNVTCGNQYCYQITVTLAGGVESVSQLRCVQAISSDVPSKITNVVASVLEEEQKVEVRITNPPASGASPSRFKTIFLRADNGSNNYQEVGVVNNQLTFIDPTANPNAQSYCYKVQYENSCGNRSEPSDPVCSIHLYSKTSSTVDWTVDSPFLFPIGYYALEILNEQGVLVDQVRLGGNSSFNPDTYNPDQQQFRYRILAYPQGSSGLISYSNPYVFVRNALVFIPDAFSPNQDTVNDFFAMQGQFVNTSRLIVYNRWGEVLFESDDAIKKGWDGRLNGQPAPEGSYVYRIEVSDLLGKNFVKIGTFLLAR